MKMRMSEAEIQKEDEICGRVRNADFMIVPRTKKANDRKPGRCAPAESTCLRGQIRLGGGHEIVPSCPKHRELMPIPRLNTHFTGKMFN